MRSPFPEYPTFSRKPVQTKIKMIIKNIGEFLFPVGKFQPLSAHCVMATPDNRKKRFQQRIVDCDIKFHFIPFKIFPR